MKGIIGAICAFIVAAIVAVFAFGSWGTIDAGHRGIVLKMGAVSGEVKNEGFYTKTPWFESVIETSIQVVKAQDETEAASKDLQTVRTTLAVNFHQKSDAVAKIYQTYGRGYVSTFIDPAIKETAKAVIAHFTAEELITKREQVREDIGHLLSQKLDPVGFVVDATNIVNFTFSKTFDQAIEAKVTAEQNALAAKNKLAQIEFEAKQKEAEAKGKANAMAIETQALQGNPQILQLRALEKWDGKLPQFLGSGNIPFVPISPTMAVR